MAMVCLGPGPPDCLPPGVGWECFGHGMEPDESHSLLHKDLRAACSVLKSLGSGGVGGSSRRQVW